MALYTVILPDVKAATAAKLSDPNATSAGSTTCTIQGSNDWWYRTFLQYDLSAIPPGAPIKSAKMYVYCYRWNDNGGSGTTNISRVTSEWSEETLCWNKQPSFTGTYLSANVKAPAVNTWAEWDVTNLVQEWVNGTYPNYGLYIKNNNEGSYRVDWYIYNHRHSSGNGTYLEVTYDWTYTSHFYYNGVLLPKLPERTIDGFTSGVINEYPHCWIRKNGVDECYDLLFSKSPFYLNADGTRITSDVETVEDILYYKLEMATVENAEEWVSLENTNLEFEINSDKTVMWSNHTIPNGSSDSDVVYVHKSYMIHLVDDEVTEFVYNGITLPKIPMEVLLEYPYCWISPSNRLVASACPWHYVSEHMMISELALTKVYKLSDLKDEWILESSNINTGDYNLLHYPKWASHDIPKNLQTSAEIYFCGSDADPGIVNSDNGTTDQLPDGVSSPTSYTIDFSNEHWTILRPDVYTITNGSVPFYVNSTFSYNGKSTLRSGGIGHSGTSETTINFSLASDGYIEFNYTVSSEGNYDKLWVYIDGTQVICVSGSYNWTVYKKVLSAGTHTMLIRYTKDGSASSGNDAGAIGYITFEGVPADFTQMYLVKYEGVLYTISEGTLIALDTNEVNSSVFLDCGSVDCPSWEHLSHMINPEVLHWFDSNEWEPELNVNMSATPFSQSIISNRVDITDDTITGIESAVITCEGTPLIAVSFDEQQTWKAWNGEVWSIISEPFSGMTKEMLESIPHDKWMELYTDATHFYIRVSLLDSISSVTQIYVDFAN